MIEGIKTIEEKIKLEKCLRKQGEKRGKRKKKKERTGYLKRKKENQRKS